MEWESLRTPSGIPKEKGHDQRPEKKSFWESIAFPFILTIINFHGIERAAWLHFWRR